MTFGSCGFKSHLRHPGVPVIFNKVIAHLFPCLRRTRKHSVSLSDLTRMCSVDKIIQETYSLLLNRPVDDQGLRRYRPMVGRGRRGIGDMCLDIIRSPEFAGLLQARCTTGGEDRVDQREADGLPETDDFVDVAALLRSLSVEQLAQAADDYYKTNSNSRDFYLSKPFTTIDAAPDELTGFAQLLAGLKPLAGMQVLDFGAGTCWTTRYMCQLGCAVTALDVSATALDLGRELFKRQPVIGAMPEVVFARFDGRTFPLPETSMDRILCMDAFHHVPNPKEIIAEMFRVLKPGGIAGFCEPGPNHSRSAQSQFEMRNHRVIENDIIMKDIRHWAQDAGFSQLKLAVYNTRSYTLQLKDFQDLMGFGHTSKKYLRFLVNFLRDRRIFFLYKGDRARADSRQREGLNGTLAVSLTSGTCRAGDTLTGKALVSNTGRNAWLPSGKTKGAVNIGVSLHDPNGRLINQDHCRIPLPGNTGPLEPGKTLKFSFTMPSPAAGVYHLVFDLVAEDVCWFSLNGAQTITKAIAVS